jgi:acetoin utilization deacetylase AcuC-like enzyme
VVANTLVFSLTGAEAERSDISAGVPMQKSTPGVLEATGGAPEPMEEVVEEAAMATGGGGHHVARGRSGGGYPLPEDPGRRAHPLCADDGGHRE